MAIYLVRRLLMAIPVLLGVTLLTFAIIQVTPGEPVRLMLGRNATEEQIVSVRQKMGLDDPLFVQFFSYIGRVAQGDLGVTIRGQRPVLEEILLRFPSTLQLTLAALSFAAVVGITLGVIAATTKHKWLDGSAMATALVGLSIPDFWISILFILFFGVHLGWVSVTGGTGLKNLILPAIALGIGPAAVLARLTRSSVLEVKREDYIRTARAKGLRERVVNVRHALRNALIPVVTVLGLQFAFMLGGAVFVESVFARPGLGAFAVSATAARDYPVVQGLVLFGALVFVLVNLLVDVLYVFLNPRISYS